MDPHVHVEQPGWSPDTGTSEDNVNYLRQLKGELADPAPAKVVARGDGGSAPVTARENPAKDADFVKATLQLADPSAFLAEITTFFQKNQLLCRDEFYKIAKRVRRP